MDRGDVRHQDRLDFEHVGRVHRRTRGLGLRIRQVFIFIVIQVAKIPTVVEWLGRCFKALADYIEKDWATALVQCFDLLLSALQVLGNAVRDIGEGIKNALSGRGFTFDFSVTEAAFRQLKGQFTGMMKDMKMPTLDTSNVAPELRKELEKVTGEIDRKKQEARDAQNAARLNAQNRGTGKTDGESKQLNPNVLIGSRDKAHFQETVGFWKKVQEAGANQRAEQFQQQQLDQSREMVRLLAQINQAVARPPAPPGGIVPR